MGVPDSRQGIPPFENPPLRTGDGMRAFIASNFMGSFAFDSDGRLIAHRLFPKRPEVMADKMRKIQAGEVLPEERELIGELKRKGIKEVIWDKKLEVRDMFCTTKKEHIGKEALQSGFRGIAIKLRWASSQAEINELLSKVSSEATRTELRKVKKDRILMNAVGMLDEIDRVSNTLLERVREWYGLYFPEGARQVTSHDRFLEMVSKGVRKTGDKHIDRLAEKSSGMEFSGQDLEQVGSMASAVLGLFERRKSLSSYVEEMCRETAPNMSAVAGPVLAARLLSLAGGLERISRMPSSTIQLLGAEKALFRHLKGQGKAPKYGILFAHPLVQGASKENKGKAARLVAAKLSLAARLDMYSGRDEGEDMRKELEKQVSVLK
jgi:nucleolar protein 56